AFGCVLLALALVTMLLGAVLGVFSVNLKRTLACSSMSQIGYILVGVACGVLLGVLVTASIRYGSRRIERITAKLMPPLTAGYMAIAAVILCTNRSLLLDIFGEIVQSAWTPRAAAGGAVGFTVRESLRFGVMRGIFSNEIYIIGLGHNLSKREVFWPYFYGCGGIQNDNRYDCISPSGFAAPLPCSPRQTA
ncbi:MAG: alanine:cation symporter family protein, partial [Clostridia bacterium]|nr:alanine:cation symporter family protein [Clostridia bacterium]